MLLVQISSFSLLDAILRPAEMTWVRQYLEDDPSLSHLKTSSRHKPKKNDELIICDIIRDREAVLRRADYLKKCNMSVSEDFSKSVREQRMHLAK